MTGVARLVVDVNNLVGALPRSGSSLGATALLGRLRALVPAEATVELVFDGPPTRGAGRPGPGLVARYAAPRTADEVILELVRVAGPPALGEDLGILVVTDDGDLRLGVRRLGAATQGTAWLIARAERTHLGAPSIGQPRPPLATSPEPDREGWRPGRGATTKRGNPRRPSRSSRPGGRRAT
ncbi:MAG TPA: hypothetical protein VEY67_01635 [Candidatus Dormibacteraeota bacterium]|nr:hypothetical protein [Candidatus Dormibacteraeota bacterium]